MENGSWQSTARESSGERRLGGERIHLRYGKKSEMKPAIQIGCTLSTLVAHADHQAQVRKADLCPGDVLLIKTRNSLYTIRAVQKGTYSVSGGWFDRKGLSGMNVVCAGMHVGWKCHQDRCCGGAWVVRGVR